MLLNRLPLYIFIITSVFVALLLDVYPLAFEYRLVRPQFVVMVVIFWIYILPQSTSMTLLLILGLFQDLLEGAPFGQHALALLIVSYICLRSCRRVRHFSKWQEVLWIFVLISVSQLINYWIQSFAGREVNGLSFLVAAASSACVWPLLSIVLEVLRQRNRISRQS